MAKITRWSNVFEVQREQARLSGVDYWNDKHFWNEFIRVRTEIFTEQDVPADAPELERRRLAVLFAERVKSSDDWWAGEWVDSPGIADWHVNQYVRKVKDSTSRSTKREGAQGDQGTPRETSYWDPVRSAEQG